MIAWKMMIMLSPDRRLITLNIFWDRKLISNKMCQRAISLKLHKIFNSQFSRIPKIITQTQFKINKPALIIKLIIDRI